MLLKWGFFAWMMPIFFRICMLKTFPFAYLFIPKKMLKPSRRSYLWLFPCNSQLQFWPKKPHPSFFYYLNYQRLLKLFILYDRFVFLWIYNEKIHLFWVWKIALWSTHITKAKKFWKILIENLIRDCRQITFVLNYRFCLLSKCPLLPSNTQTPVPSCS